MPSTPVDARLDLSDPDLLADHLPLDEFRLAAPQSTGSVESAIVHSGIR